MKDKNIGIGDHFQNETKYKRQSLGGGHTCVSRAEPYKICKDAAVRIDLPEAPIFGGPSLWETLHRRRSIREFRNSSITLDQLSRLLWSANGITLETGGYSLRTSPSAGALYPIETYICANRVAKISSGIYHHNILHNQLELLKKGNFGGVLAKACLGQTMCEDAAAVFVFTAIAARSKWKYSERAWRYIYLDAGHIGAGIHLAAEALGLGCCMIGAFFDDEVNDIIGIDGSSETAVYSAAVGVK